MSRPVERQIDWRRREGGGVPVFLHDLKDGELRVTENGIYARWDRKIYLIHFDEVAISTTSTTTTTSTSSTTSTTTSTLSTTSSTTTTAP